MVLGRGEDAVLARACSNHSPRALAIAAVSGMYGVGGRGKALADCFFDRAARRTSRQLRKDPRYSHGRISLSLNHAVGKDAIRLINRLQLGHIFDVDSMNEERWDIYVDHPDGWRRYGKRLQEALKTLLHNSKEAAEDVLHSYPAVQKAWMVIRATQRPAAQTVGNVVVLSRLLNSYGKYSYHTKYPTLYRMLLKPNSIERLLEWYSKRSRGKARRAQFMRALVAPYSDCHISDLGAFADEDDTLSTATLRGCQSALYSCGQYKGAIDGKFGRRSIRALNLWADKHGHKQVLMVGQYLLPIARELLAEEL